MFIFWWNCTMAKKKKRKTDDFTALWASIQVRILCYCYLGGEDPLRLNAGCGA